MALLNIFGFILEYPRRAISGGDSYKSSRFSLASLHGSALTFSLALSSDSSTMAVTAATKLSLMVL